MKNIETTEPIDLKQLTQSLTQCASKTHEILRALSDVDCSYSCYPVDAKSITPLHIDIEKINTWNHCIRHHISELFQLYKITLYLKACKIANTFFLYRNDSTLHDRTCSVNERYGFIPYYVRCIIRKYGVTVSWLKITTRKNKSRTSSFFRQDYIPFSETSFRCSKSAFNAANKEAKELITTQFDPLLALIRRQSKILVEIKSKIEHLDSIDKTNF